jgi:hypothetical protein
MSEQEPFARLPERIELDLSEVAVVLGALDRAAELADPNSASYRAIRSATRLLTAKLWPELGDLLDDEDH